MSKIKVGDRIRIYSNADIWTGVVKEMYPNGRLAYISSSSGLRLGAHIKQCRKLVKKRAREWWVYPNNSYYKDWFENETGAVVRTTPPKDLEGWVYIRECKWPKGEK